MADPVNFEDWAEWPPDTVLEVRRSLLRAFFTKVIAKTLALPEVWSGLAGQVLVVTQAAAGPAPIGGAGVGAALFGNVGVRGFKAGALPIAASTSLTDAAHGGASLDLAPSSAITLTVALDADPAVGVSDGFTCELLRCAGAAAVQIVAAPGLTLRNPDEHTRVADVGLARLRVVGSDLYFHGYTAD